MDQNYLSGYQQGYQDALAAVRQANSDLRIPIAPPPLPIPPALMGELNEKNYCTTLKEMIIQLLQFPNFVPEKPVDQLQKLKKWDDDRYEIMKTKHCYLLLDSRITGNGFCSFWRFILAIMYIGMGEYDRMLKHVYETMEVVMADALPEGKQVAIDEVWRDGAGIIHIPIFPLLYAQESEVHEATMIYAIEPSLPREVFQLKNKKIGTFHRSETEFTAAQEMELGTYNLWKAWKMFEQHRNIPVTLKHFPESRDHQY